MALRKIKQAMSAEHEGRWSVDWGRWILKHGWTNVVKLTAQPDDQPFEISHNEAGLRELNLSKAEVRDIIQSSIAPPPPTQWSL